MTIRLGWVGNPAMAKRLYVGNLAFAATSAEIRALFGRYGAVGMVEIMNDPATGRSRGFGFVTMPNDAEADEAVYQIDGSEFRNRRLNVNEAQPKAAPEFERYDDRRGPGPGPGWGFDREPRFASEPRGGYGPEPRFGQRPGADQRRPRPGDDGRYVQGPRARPTPGSGLGLGERLRGRGERP